MTYQLLLYMQYFLYLIGSEAALYTLVSSMLCGKSVKAAQRMSSIFLHHGDTVSDDA
jgi:hypothetical protein